MSTGLFLASIRERIKDLEGAARRVRNSLSTLKNQDSSYAQDHRALLAAYVEALAVFRRHHDEATNAHPVVLEEPTGPPCPVCCHPSWPMLNNGCLWRCSRPGCMVASFDEFGRPHSYNINGRQVLSMDGVLALAKEAFPDGPPSCVDALRHLPVPLSLTDDSDG